MMPYDNEKPPVLNPIRIQDFEPATRWIQDYILENFGLVVTRVELVSTTWFFYATGRRMLARLEHTLIEELDRKLDLALHPPSTRRA